MKINFYNLADLEEENKPGTVIVYQYITDTISIFIHSFFLTRKQAIGNNKNNACAHY